MKDKKVVLNNNEYKIIRDDEECFDKDLIQERIVQMDQFMLQVGKMMKYLLES